MILGTDLVPQPPTGLEAATCDRAARVRGMFAGVARRYDFLNHLLSAGLDHRWRSRAAAACPCRDGAWVLDLCGGTADQALALLRRLPPTARVLVADFSRPMLRRARAKLRAGRAARRAALLEADALALPLPDGCVDAVTVAFGLRNVADVPQALREIVRVLRPGGRAVVLEFHAPRPRGPLAGAFRFYLRRVVPWLGRLLAGSGPGAYRYLVASIEAFGPSEALAAHLRAAGLADVRVERLPGGVAAVLVGTRPARPA
jgi:demethylmenaquinone methyltransferase/2-methoxy-6-polyprenyl-1,4-benzoquinol methylase